MDVSALEGAEYAPSEDLAGLQRKRWRAQSRYLSRHSEFYRGRGSLDPRLEAIAELPFTDKETLREDQRAHPPFGSYLAASPELVRRVHRSSGTSGVAMTLALSEADARMSAVVGARAQRAAGLGPGHRVIHCLNYQLWMGGYTDHAILEATGATVIPFGVGGSQTLIRTIRELGVTAISCTPSYPRVLERVLEADFPGLAPRDLGLKLGLFGGEAGLDDAAFRARLEHTWGFAARNANYGVSDVLCNFAAQTPQCQDLHFMALDVLYPELIDPETLDLLPWRDGECGELVLTHLAKECQPLVRFRTGDMVALTGTGVAACGRTAPRLRVVGRCDDMVIVRGINLFPTMVASAIGAVAELSGEYRIVLDTPPPHELLPLHVELAAPCADTVALAARVADVIKARLGARARVRVHPPGSFPAIEGKTPRVVRAFAAS